jgi:hypothetical protein
MDEVNLRNLMKIEVSCHAKIDYLCEELTSCIQKAIEASTPRATIRQERNFWWSNELRKLRSNWKKLKRAKSSAAKAARQVYEKAIIDAKEAAWTKFLKETESADESYLRYKILCKKVDGEPLTPVLGPNGFTNSTMETAQVLLKNNFPELDTNFTAEDLKVIKEVTDYASQSSPNLVPLFTSCEIKAAVNKIKLGKAPGPDGIPGSIIKDLSTQLVPLLVKLLNGCLTVGYFPKDWKAANVIFLQKPGKKLEDPKGRRPISLISHLGKVLERVLLTRLNFLAGKERWLSDLQFGFRKGISAQNAALNLASKISTGFKSRMDSLCVFLDIVGAFNDTWPDAIAHRLVARRAPPPYVKLIRSYLNYRIALVNTSEGVAAQKLTKSCPQGGVLSPFLYSLFIDELLTNAAISADLKQGFADDIVFCVQGNNRKTLEKRMNRILCHATEWAKKWKIQFSILKTKAVLFSNNVANPSLFY